jgi:hypothetical protein
LCSYGLVSLYPETSRSSQEITPPKVHLHLTALGDDHVKVRHILAAVTSLGSFHLLDYVHTFEDLAKYNVLVVKEGCGDGGDEELRSVGVGSSVLRPVSMDINNNRE